MRLRILDTDKTSERLRAQAIDLKNQRLLITRFAGSEQEKDLTEPANCKGFGRIRHFRRGGTNLWPPNPLPIEPASRALMSESGDEFRAQVFQNAVCNWRCWYCFVDFKLLAANRNYSEWLTADELVDLYLAEPKRPAMIDLTGGQPDLTPEWVPWMMRALTKRRLERSVFLWSDDNLSNDYFWKYLSPEDRETVAGYPMYARVACFKGFDPDSFTFNTSASPDLFERQFDIFRSLLNSGINMYAYVTLTCENVKDISVKIRAFMDRLQAVHANLPLRTVPLEIRVFSPVTSRINDARTAALANQNTALYHWQQQLELRFPPELLKKNITEVSVKGYR